AITGSAVGVGYPVAGYEIRALASDEEGEWDSASGDVQPGGTSVFTGRPLPSDARRSERTITWSWPYRAAHGESEWAAVPGAARTHHRFYTLIGEPLFAPGGGGPQHSAASG